MTTLKLDPTLFIFLGTSPAQVGWRIKKQLDSAYGEIPIFRYFWMDTDTNVQQDALEWIQSSSVARSEIGGFNASVVLQNIQSYPKIRSWWPEDARLRPGNLGRGAKQMRPVGRLSLMRMFNDATQDSMGSFYAKLQQSIAEVCDISNIQKTKEMKTENLSFIVNPERARIIIVFSTSGGTGSGTAFDVAYLCRKILTEARINYTITGVAILPRVIEKAMRGQDIQQENKIKANTYAWFKENDFLIKNQKWNVSYTGVDVNLVHQPFDINFVIDIGNQRGQFLNAEQDVYKMIAQSLFLISSTAVAADADSMQDNMGITNDEFQGKSRSYSSFASAALVYPKERIKNYCGAKISEEILNIVNTIPKQLTPNKVDTETLINQLELSYSKLVESLLSKRRVVNDNLEFIQAAKLPGEALERITEEFMNDQVELEGFISEIKIEEEQKKVEKSLALRAKILDLLKSDGPGHVMYILDKLVEDSPKNHPTSFAGNKKALSSQGITQESISTAKAQLESDKKSLADMSGNFGSSVINILLPKEWKDKFRKTKDACISSMEQLNNVILRNKAEQSAISIYDALINEVSSIRTSINSLRDTFTQAAALLATEAEHYLTIPTSQTNLFELNQEVVDSKYIENYFKKNSADIDRIAIYNLFINQQANLDINTLGSWEKSKLVKALRVSAEQIFAPKIDKVTILEAMIENHGDNATQVIKEKLDQLVEYCHPFWRFSSDSGLEPLPQGPSFLGLMEADTPLLPKEYRDNMKYQVVSTGLKDAIHLVRILHGVPSSLLSGIDQWKSQYDQLKNGIDFLHLFPGAKEAEEVLPDQDSRPRDIFAYALAFGFITKRAQKFYFDPEKRYVNSEVIPAPEDKIAEGRSKAEDTFIQHSEWVDRLEDLVNFKIDAMGNINAIEMINNCIVALKNEIDKLPSKSATRDQLNKEIKALEGLKNNISPNR